MILEVGSWIVIFAATDEGDFLENSFPNPGSLILFRCTMNRFQGVS